MAGACLLVGLGNSGPAYAAKKEKEAKVRGGVWVCVGGVRTGGAGRMHRKHATDWNRRPGTSGLAHVRSGQAEFMPHDTWHEEADRTGPGSIRVEGC